MKLASIGSILLCAATGLAQSLQLEAYAFAYFTGNTIDGEKIYFAASNGNDALSWSELNNGQPVLTSTMGTKGLRDPFLMRSHDGGTFYLLATDLSIGSGTSWGDAVKFGSRYLEIWESDDLVNWSDQRHVLVSPPNAGMTWAPEAYYDDSICQYVVFWASALYDDADVNRTGSTYDRMLYATTSDFVTFSDTQIWQDSGASRIDSDVIKVNATYYRFTKDEGSVTGCTDIIQEQSPNLRATLDGWTITDSCIGRDAGTQAVEGPTSFKSNPGDVNGDKYYLFVDEYGGRGYIPLETSDISKPVWKVSDSYQLPASPRHGTVLPITADELAKLTGSNSKVKRSETCSDNTTEIGDFSLAGAANLLKVPPIVDTALRQVVFAVVPGTDLTALKPTFCAASGISSAPESGTSVDLSSNATYVIRRGDVEVAEWTFKAVEMKSPALPGFNADPNIAVFGNTFYIYCTTDGYAGWGGQDFYVWKSSNLVDWTRGDRPILTLNGTAGNVPWASGNAWAPTIIERDGKYYFYFSGQNPQYNRKTIGAAVADHPEGPFTAQPEAMILNNERLTSGQAIDPAAFFDPQTEKYYLFWGNGVALMAELNADMVSINEDTMQNVTSSSGDGESGPTDFREGSFVNYRAGVYHLTYSIDDTGSPNYRVGYATATSVTGPWTDRGVVLQQDPAQGILATGHNSIIRLPDAAEDQWYIAYHRFAIPAGNGTHREVTIDKLEFDQAGFFVSVRPTLAGVEPVAI